jgi:adenylosuccinate synthase
MFRFMRPDDLAAQVIQHLMRAVPELDKDRIDDVIVGNATPEAEQGLNIGRMISLIGLGTDKVPGMTVNRYCASGLETIAIAAAKIQAGQADCIIAGGVETMSPIPFGGWRIVPNLEIAKTHADYYWGMGLTAEAVAREFGVSREDQDRFAFESHQKAMAAIHEGRFKDDIAPIEIEEVLAEYLAYAEILRPYVTDTVLLLDKALKAGKTVLLEGSQGTLLDVDHGTYPFVTSSNPTAGGASTGSGIGPTKITRVIGIVKAYTTRVGSGPFPTELFDEDGESLRRIGGEVGVTTGRARRCGWYDAPIARYAVRVNGLTDFFLTKLDVLTGWEKIPVCVAYEIDGQRVEELPASQTDFHHAKPIYEYLPGWTENISGARKFSDLPANAQAYVKFLEKISDAPISAIGVGPGRDETISITEVI